MTDVEIHEHRLETEARDGVPVTVLVIETEIPIPPQTHIDQDMLPEIIGTIKKLYLDQGKTIDDFRVVHGGDR